MIIRFGNCRPNGVGRKLCHWFNDIVIAIEYSKSHDEKIFIKVGNKPYKKISNMELNSIYTIQRPTI